MFLFTFRADIVLSWTYALGTHRSFGLTFWVHIVLLDLRFGQTSFFGTLALKKDLCPKRKEIFTSTFIGSFKIQCLAKFPLDCGFWVARVLIGDENNCQIAFANFSYIKRIKYTKYSLNCKSVKSAANRRGADRAWAMLHAQIHCMKYSEALHRSRD